MATMIVGKTGRSICHCAVSLVEYDHKIRPKELFLSIEALLMHFPMTHGRIERKHEGGCGDYDIPQLVAYDIVSLLIYIELLSQNC